MLLVAICIIGIRERACKSNQRNGVQAMVRPVVFGFIYKIVVYIFTKKNNRPSKTCKICYICKVFVKTLVIFVRYVVVLLHSSVGTVYSI